MIDIKDVDLITPQSFADGVEEVVWEVDCTYIEAIITYCDRMGIELDEVSRLVNKPLKEKLEFEGIAEGYLKKTTQITF